jgi:hypothetical protein
MRKITLRDLVDFYIVDKYSREHGFDYETNEDGLDITYEIDEHLNSIIEDDIDELYEDIINQITEEHDL